MKVKSPSQAVEVGVRMLDDTVVDWPVSVLGGAPRDSAGSGATEEGSSILAWRIPGTGEPGGLPSVGLHRVGHN